MIQSPLHCEDMSLFRKWHNFHLQRQLTCRRFGSSSSEYGIISGKQHFAFTDKPHSHILETNAIGPYTVCRTVNQQSIFKYEMHIDRLKHTLYQNNGDLSPFGLTPKSIYETVTDVISRGLCSFQTKTESRIMVYVDDKKLFRILSDQEEDGCDALRECMVTHFCSLPKVERPIRAVIRGHGHDDDEEGDHGIRRLEPRKKDSQWFHDRNQWRREEVDGALRVNEVVIWDKESDSVLEGLSSSFAVLKEDGNLYTAPLEMGVLDGTVRSFVMECLEEYDAVNVVQEVPTLNDIDQWKAAFLMSTTRMMLPIDELFVDIDGELECGGIAEPTPRIMFDNDSNAVLQSLSRFIDSKIDDHSTAILMT